MKTLEEVESRILELSTKKNKEVADWKKKIKDANKAVEEAKANLAAAENTVDLEGYKKAKDELWSATNTVEFCAKQLKQSEEKPFITAQERNELSLILNQYLLETNKEQYQDAYEVIESLKTISDESNDLFNRFTKLFDKIGEPMHRLDYVSGFYEQVINTPMYPTIEREANN
ncbi:hypothetical protein [Enterococcus thailandicus]|uniref:hypothetical protein n=1 Tax=Enterococcus thailandicus TaxID=417368 RepID=UPI0035E393BC